ncbi:hypothetical protein LWP59_11205 [Amycolatopsis acidiphila]|uniref:PE domain-containing protein n=1 Tax=Amycolatopsis acidiphila TaxID=715473 RepID=A0A557ZY97_9PSEU|nr:hypothetical protein [Amycolatopsis acidiphila]TVT16974.1 hypothetical protein FNH06_33330 [Amycolatopsis acidiphila]UIJ62142.1 hypothetical protein LWP59_11205 [Amycolatopsis acidiphila]GHG92079.1 hypothetical protein GCM10017788_68740 [Amycolatopsis acidiphila]
MVETKAAPSVDAGAFAVSPELATAAFTQLTQLQDVVGEMVREANVLGRTVPLGGGYAAEIGEFMARYGIDGPGSAADQLTRFGRQLDKLKGDIQKALQRYRDTDDDAADGVDCSGG